MAPSPSRGGWQHRGAGRHISERISTGGSLGVQDVGFVPPSECAHRSAFSDNAYCSRQAGCLPRRLKAVQRSAFSDPESFFHKCWPATLKKLQRQAIMASGFRRDCIISLSPSLLAEQQTKRSGILLQFPVAPPQSDKEIGNVPKLSLEPGVSSTACRDVSER